MAILRPILLTLLTILPALTTADSDAQPTTLATLLPQATTCPTFTKTIQRASCAATKTCAFSSCELVQTAVNPCGCPSSIPTATLVAACDEDDPTDCPYDGCEVRFRSVKATGCRTSEPTSSAPTSTVTTVVIITTANPPPPPTTVSIGITTLPSQPPPCPTVTKTTSPAGCPVLPCPVPTCIYQQAINVPCGCTPHTELHVKGCASTCPDGCATRTQTYSIGC